MKILINKIILKADSESKKSANISFQLYKQILKLLETISQLNNCSEDFILDYIHCLVKIGKHEEAKSIIGNLKNINNMNKLYYYSAFIERKQMSIAKAKNILNNEFYMFSKEDIDCEREKRIIRNIENYKKDKKTIYKHFKDKFMNTNNINYNVKKCQTSSNYNILCCDVGGIRGIMEAVFLSELELRLKTSCSNIFDIMAGTSTGGIITAGLSIPKDENLTIPKFKAVDLLDLFVNKGNEIFIKSNSDYDFIATLTNPKYKSSGRLSLFNKYFGNQTIKNSLNQLVLTAVNQSNFQETFLFTKYDAINNNQDFSFVDSVMATSAAPTFFEAHKIKDNFYFDGGVQLNSPSMRAVSEAIRYGANEKDIFVLSLGTGLHISNPLEIGASQGLLYWAPNIHKVIMASQEANTNLDLYYRFKENYVRWQVNLPVCVGFDDIDSVNYLLDLSTDYLSEIKETGELDGLIKKLEKKIEY